MQNGDIDSIKVEVGVVKELGCSNGTSPLSCSPLRSLSLDLLTFALLPYNYNLLFPLHATHLRSGIYSVSTLNSGSTAMDSHPLAAL
jgi:hypothetical protein